MRCAVRDKKCSVTGIDPEPYKHGVGRQWDNNNFIDTDKSFQLFQGTGESLPFSDSEFDAVYSSHVLEHVQNEIKFLQEAKRVLKDQGVLIIGMPTATMAWINLITNVLFTTHHRIVNFFFSRIKIINAPGIPFKFVFLPNSLSIPERTILYDLKHYKINNWKKNISTEFRITKIVLPALYPYPDYRQLFKLKKEKNQAAPYSWFVKTYCCRQ